ncbi:hypothetical protein ZTR_08794 [Talaromyces verruculosus]|nr:hypothetical protein ZTR_08794 [Talaromyces verruculosus]
MSESGPGARVSIKYFDFSNTYEVTQKTEPDYPHEYSLDPTEGVKTRVTVNWSHGPLELFGWADPDNNTLKLDIHVGGIYVGKLESALEEVQTNYEVNLRMYTGSFSIDGTYGLHVKLNISAITEDGGSWKYDGIAVGW